MQATRFTTGGYQSLAANRLKYGGACFAGAARSYRCQAKPDLGPCTVGAKLARDGIDAVIQKNRVACIASKLCSHSQAAMAAAIAY